MKEEIKSLDKNSCVNQNIGSCHWWSQRFTAILLVPLVMFFVCFVFELARNQNESLKGLLLSPWYMIVIFGSVIIGLYHGSLGMKEIIIDYIPSICLRKKLIFIINILTVSGTALACAGLIKHYFL